MATKTPSAADMPRRAHLLDVHDVADLLNCSVRHVHRLARTRQMPKPVRVGSLVRWNAAAVRAWIEAGCPASSTTTSDQPPTGEEVARV